MTASVSRLWFQPRSVWDKNVGQAFKARAVRKHLGVCILFLCVEACLLGSLKEDVGDREMS